MKKLKFEKDTIVPFWLKDLEYMQEGIEEALKGIVEGLSLDKKDTLISGCEIIYKDDKISMTQGWFYHKGEILPVEALPESDYENDSPTVYLEKVTEYSDLGDRKIVNKQGEEIASPYEKIYLKPTLSPTGDIEVKQGDLGLVERIVTTCQNEITQAYKKADDNLEARVTKACETRDAALEASIKEIYGNIDNDIQNIKSDDYSVGYITKGHVTQLFGDVYIPVKDGDFSMQINGLPIPLQTISMVKRTVYGLDALVSINEEGTIRIAIPNLQNDDTDYLKLNDILYLS